MVLFALNLLFPVLHDSVDSRQKTRYCPINYRLLPVLFVPSPSIDRLQMHRNRRNME